MEEAGKYVCSGERGNRDVVKLDKENPVSPLVCELVARLVTKRRAAEYIRAQELGSGLENPASELWGEMPLVAREHEASLGEEGAGLN